jgi:putative flippase GtrA
MKELTRFFFVSVGGVVVDIAIAYAIATMLGTPLWIAAALGFSVAACGNYILHEVWTFRRETSRLSSKRALYYFITSGVTLFSRLVVVAWLSTSISRDHALVILIGGAAVSFFVNFIISKLLVFSKRAENKSHY